MKFKTLIIIYIASLGAFSCSSNDEQFVNIDGKAFVYIETMVGDDYSGESTLFISNNNQTIPIQTLNSIIQYQILNSKVIYKDGYDILEYNPTTNNTSTIANLRNVQIHSFDLSPDDEYLAFSNYEDIFLLHLESGSSENVTADLEGDFRFPKWSPDGSSLLMRNNVPIIRPGDSYPTATGNFKIFSVYEQTFQDVEMFDQFASPSYAEWSPNSNMVVYEQYQGIFTFNVDTEQMSRITSENVVATNPKFSNDGNRISYFTSDLSDNGNNWQNYLTIYEIANETSEIVNDSYSYDVSWKKDSSQVLYCTETGILLYNLINGTITTLVEPSESIYLHSVNFLN